MLPHNLYHVLLDGSRCVTQRMRIHIKPILLFPIYSGNVLSGPPPLVIPNDAPQVAGQPLNIPNPASDRDDEKTAPVEPATAQQDADEDLQHLVDLTECPVNCSSRQAQSSLPLLCHRANASADASAALWLGIMNNSRRGELEKRPSLVYILAVWIITS